MFRRGRQQLGEEWLPELAEASAVLDRARSLLAGYEDTYAVAVDREDVVEVTEASKRGDEAFLCFQRGRALLSAWGKTYLETSGRNTSIRYGAALSGVSLQSMGLELEIEVWKRQLSIKDPEAQQWLGEFNGYGLGAAKAGRQDVSRVISGAREGDLTFDVSSARKYFETVQGMLARVVDRFPETH